MTHQVIVKAAAYAAVFRDEEKCELATSINILVPAATAAEANVLDGVGTLLPYRLCV